MQRPAASRFRRALIPIVIGSLAVAVMPAVRIQAGGPVQVAA